MKLFDGIQDGETIRLGGNRFDLYGKDTVQAEYAIANNDASLKSILCHLQGKKGVTIDGEGAMLMFHDRITPFLLDGCEDVCLRNFVIDYERPFHTQGTILSADESTVELRIHPEYSFRVDGCDLYMQGECWENDLQDGIMLFQEFDPGTGSLAYDSPVLVYRVGGHAAVDPTSPLPMRILTAEQTGFDTLRLHGFFPWRYSPGNELVMTHELRHNSGIVLHRCKNVRLQDIHIIHTGAMGIVAQLCDTVTLDRVRVASVGNPHRMVSTNCDATHFIACSGLVSLTDCVLENMMDDGVNVHGVYTRVASLENAYTLTTEIMHFQQQGVLYYQPGDQVSVTKGKTAGHIVELTVRQSELVGKDLIRLVFEQPIVEVSVLDFLENQTKTPAVQIRRLRTGHNRPRGVLVTTPKPVLIEDSQFSNSGYGIHIAGDTCFWYESGAVRDVLIHGCRFFNWGHAAGDYAIAITPEFEPEEGHTWFHQGIVIEDNLFEGFQDGEVLAEHVKGLRVAGNRHRRTGDYLKRHTTPALSMTACEEILYVASEEMVELLGPFQP